MDSDRKKYVDHPAPGVFLMALMLVGLILTIKLATDMATDGGSALGWGLVAVVVAIIVFYSWAFYTTYYTIGAEGLEVRFGPWTRRYPWSDFGTAFWQRGMFASRIGWPSVTPCVRFTDAVLLKRRAKWLGLYLTPNDSRAFLVKISEFAPELTRETVL